MSIELRCQMFRCIPVIAMVLVTQGITGCVSTNAPDPTVVTEAIEAALAPPPVTSNSGYTGGTVGVTATAHITASGVFSKSNSVAVFASIGEVGTRSIVEPYGTGGCVTNREIAGCVVAAPIQKSSSVSKVSGIGSIAYTGLSGDAGH
jgi:hypothetical protein